MSRWCRHKGARLVAPTYVEYGSGKQSSSDDSRSVDSSLAQSASTVALALAKAGGTVDVHGATPVLSPTATVPEGEELVGSSVSESGDGAAEPDDEHESDEEGERLVSAVKVDYSAVQGVAPERVVVQVPCALIKATGVTSGIVYVLKGSEMVWEPLRDSPADRDSVKTEDRQRRWRVHDVYAMFMRHYRLRDAALELFLREYEGKKKQYFFSFPLVRAPCATRRVPCCVCVCQCLALYASRPSASS